MKPETKIAKVIHNMRPIDPITGKALSIRYPESAWSIVRMGYVSGESVKSLSVKYSIPLQAIYKRIRRENWMMIRSTTAIEIQKNITKSTEELLTEAGLPKAERIKRLVEGVTQPIKTIYEKVPGSRSDKDPEEPQTLITTEPDYALRLSYLKEIHALTGDYAPKKQDITSNNKELKQPIYNQFNVTELKAMIINRLNNTPPEIQKPYQNDILAECQAVNALAENRETNND